MTFLYKVNGMRKDEKKGGAFRKLTVISIKTVKITDDNQSREQVQNF